ncbi:DnaJ domain-containing protein [Tanacetum coccineum]|uniref:DnaJ domain-containing protein n=1 Tax=Tanacetum coccineum TaxID=301880 RepID=A0ABQ5AHZ1_9ASTR
MDDDEFITLMGLKPQGGGKSSPMKPPSSSSPSSISDFDYDTIFNKNSSSSPSSVNYNQTKFKTQTSHNTPLYDKPLYDDHIFHQLPKVNSKPVRYGDDVFASVSNDFDHLFGSSGRPWEGSAESGHGGDLDDLLPGFRTAAPAAPSSSRKTLVTIFFKEVEQYFGYRNYISNLKFYQLENGRNTLWTWYLQGVFGHGMLHKGHRHAWTNGIQIRVMWDAYHGWNSDPSPTSTGNTKDKSNAVDDPFVVLESMSTPGASSKGLFEDPLEEISKLSKSRSTKAGVSSASGGVFGDIDSLIGLGKPVPTFAKETNSRVKGQSPSEEGSSMRSGRSSVSREPIEESFFGYSDSQSQTIPFDDVQESHQTVRNSRRSFDQATSPTSRTETSSQVGTSPESEEYVQHADDIWLSVSEIPLFTPITRAPPPLRPPPPIPTRASKSERASFASNSRTFDDDFSSSFNSAKYSKNANASFASSNRNKESVQVHRDEQVMDEEREREEREREQRKVEKERNREIEREKARQAVEKANNSSPMERAEKAAAEAQERASAEKAAAESREKEAREKDAVAKAQAEARCRAERAAVERVTAEARERAAAEARDRAAAAAKMNQQKKENDLDSFFSMGSSASSAPKASATANDPATDPLSQVRRGPEGAQRSSSNTGAPPNLRKASPTTNFVDDLNSIFEAATPAADFQDVDGESEERRRARLERQQRTDERAAKALAEKNQRDLQNQKEQEQRQRVSVTLDVEIKHWVAGKEGNLRSMLSSLQYVLWPECGWQPISLTDLITGASVKKAYRKATLCIHPDKVQQKGATIQQKYVAEKVFDLLKVLSLPLIVS